MVVSKLKLEPKISTGRPLGSNTTGLATLVADTTGTLYVQHPLMKVTKAQNNTATWHNKAFLDFANAHGPEDLLAFIGKHGFLFEPWNTGDINTRYRLPTVGEIESAFYDFEWSRIHHKAVTRQAKKLLDDSEANNKQVSWDKPLFQFVPQEYLGDWIAARKVFLFALELFESTIGRKTVPAWETEIDLTGAVKYLDLVRNYTRRYTSIPHGANCPQQHGFILDGNTLRYIPLGKDANVTTVLGALYAMHVPGGLQYIGNPLDGESFIFKHLISAIWWQMFNEIKDREIRRCCISSCSCIHVRTANSPRQTCSKPCTQALKEGR